jgi:hypothetical protein
MKKFLTSVAGAAALGTPMLAFAQVSGTQPATASASAPPLRYQSAYADYRPYQDVKSGDWKAMNDAAGKSGGHAMSMPMSMPMGGASAPAGSASAASMPAMPGHSGQPMPMRGGKK